MSSAQPRPHVVYHVGTTADGSSNCPDADFKLYYETAARAWPGAASLTGSNTMAAGESMFGLGADDLNDTSPAPVPTAHPGAGPLIVVDTKGRVRCWRALISQPTQLEPWSAFASVCTASTPPEHVRYLRSVGVVPIVVAETADGHCDLVAVLREIARVFGATTVRVDSGGVLAGALLAADALDELSVQVNPMLACAGPKGFAWMKSAGAAVGRPALTLKSSEVVGNVVWIRYNVCHKH
eukprot:m51a1_g4527 hypothetical protein (239) ;mRNA; r:15348-16166